MTGLTPPVCQKTQFARVNHLGNAFDSSVTFVTSANMPGSVAANRFLWKVPSIPSPRNPSAYFSRGIEDAYRAHQDEGFVVLGVNVGEPGAIVEPFITDMGITYPVLLDETTEVSRSYRAVGLPASLIIDREGVIQARHVGFLSDAQLAEYLEDVLPAQ